MLPAVGSFGVYGTGGQPGVVLSARVVASSEDGERLVQLRIKSKGACPACEGQGAGPAAAVEGRDVSDAAAGARLEHGAPASEGAASVAVRRLDQLTAAERAEVTRLQQRDQQVRQEEKAHAAVAGDLGGAIQYTYARGLDGRQYAVGGSIGIRGQVLSGDPEEAERLAGRLASAALAATNPSAADLAAARRAYGLAAGADGEATRERQRGLDVYA